MDSRARRVADEMDVVGEQPAVEPIRRRRARPPGADGRGPLELRVAARARQHDRGRDDRDPQEHRRRAGARPAEGTLGGGHNMDFDLNDEQKEIKQVAHELLAVRSPFAKVREAAESAAYDPALWNELVELGWPGIAVSSEHGGQGLGAVELSVLVEELGYACAATPYLSTATAAAVIEATGSPAQRSRWLPGLASGEQTAGIGSRELAADAQDAGVIVLLDGDDAQLVERSAADVEEVVSIDPTRRFATVTGEGEPLGAGAADRVRTAIASEVIGICQRALEMTLEYVK